MPYKKEKLHTMCEVLKGWHPLDAQNMIAYDFTTIL